MPRPIEQIDAGQEATPVELTILETSPTSITWHKIWDHELDSLTNISRPITSSLATTAIGAWIGLSPTLAATLTKIASGKPIDQLDAVNSALWVACFSVGSVLAFFAIRAHVDAQKVKSKIRARQSKAIG